MSISDNHKKMSIYHYSVWVPCPSCKKKHDFRSNASSEVGDCDVEFVAFKHKADIDGQNRTCSCGTYFTFRLKGEYTIEGQPTN